MTKKDRAGLHFPFDFVRKPSIGHVTDAAEPLGCTPRPA
jgi:hypothetical protein